MDTEDLRTIVLAVAVALVGVWYVVRRRSTQSQLPPGPWGFPVIGVAPSLIWKNQFAAFREWAKRYGPVVSVPVMGQRLIILSDLDMIRDVLKRDVFSARPKIFFFSVINEEKGVISSEGELWREQRRFGLSTLRDFGMGKVKLEEAIQEEIQFLTAEIEKKNGEPFDFHKVIQTAVCNIIVSLLFGKRYEYNDRKLDVLQRIITDTVQNVNDLNNTVSVMPWLRHLPGDIFKYWKALENKDILLNHIQEEINQHKATYQPDVTRDFVDAYLHRMNENKDNSNSTFTERQLLFMCTDLFQAGLETTSTTLRWAVLYLLHNPYIQAKLHEDIDREIGCDNPPSMMHRTHLSNVEATLNETLRYSCLVPGSVPHATSESCTLAGYCIPKESVIIPNIYKVHFDPKHWKDPMDFKPERFLDVNGHVTKPDALIPFGVGKRACLGESLAKMELFMFFCGLLQKFTFIPEVDGKPPSKEPVSGIVFAPEFHKIRAIRRKG